MARLEGERGWLSSETHILDHWRAFEKCGVLKNKYRDSGAPQHSQLIIQLSLALTNLCCLFVFLVLLCDFIQNTLLLYVETLTVFHSVLRIQGYGLLHKERKKKEEKLVNSKYHYHEPICYYVTIYSESREYCSNRIQSPPRSGSSIYLYM